MKGESPCGIPLVAEFLRAARRPRSVDPRHNGYVVFGVLWGLIIDLLLFGRPGATTDLTRGPLMDAAFRGSGHLPLVAVCPLILGWVFGTLGTIRAEKDELQKRTLQLLDAEVRHRTRSLHEMYLQ